MIDPKMSFSDAVIILREWKLFKDRDSMTKRQIDDFVRAMFVVYGGR